MKRKIIVGLLLFVTMIIIGGFVIWHNPSLKKELLRLYLGSMIVNGINNDAKPAATKLGMDIYAINQYPKITIEIKLQSYDGNDGVSKTQLKHQSCEFIDVFQTMREREKSIIYGLLSEDKVLFQFSVFNSFNQKIQSASQVLAECPNFPYA
jgi:hypothetical protein